MTNKDKFLKDGVSVEELGKGIDTIYLSDDNIANIEQATIKFFSQEVTPTLTEDERVILRNIDKGYKKIGRYGKTICVFYIDDIHQELDVFNHLFQFIKERRRILY